MGEVPEVVSPVMFVNNVLDAETITTTVDKVAIGMHAVNVAKQISISQQLYCYQFQIRRRPNLKNYFTVTRTSTANSSLP
jgi:hypothetical protein